MECRREVRKHGLQRRGQYHHCGGRRVGGWLTPHPFLQPFSGLYVLMLDLGGVMGTPMLLARPTLCVPPWFRCSTCPSWSSVSRHPEELELMSCHQLAIKRVCDIHLMLDLGGVPGPLMLLARKTLCAPMV